MDEKNGGRKEKSYPCKISVTRAFWLNFKKKRNWERYLLYVVKLTGVSSKKRSGIDHYKITRGDSLVTLLSLYRTFGSLFCSKSRRFFFPFWLLLGVHGNDRISNWPKELRQKLKKKSKKKRKIS